MIGKLLNNKMAERTRRFLGKTTGVYLKLKRFTPSASPDLRTATIIKQNKIDTVIDVGANTGQFAESLLDFGYTGEIVSFEPVAQCHRMLRERSKKYPKWTVAERGAIGEKNGSVPINVTGDTVFSSILKIEDWHSSLKPTSAIVATEQVPLNTLDTVIGNYVADIGAKRVLLKIDTQGYEKQVLAGAEEVIKKIVGIKIEIPLSPIYDGVGLTFYSTLDFLRAAGFVPYSFNNEGVNLQTGRVNTIDGLFLRE